MTERTRDMHATHSFNRSARNDGQGGQALVLMVGGMIAALAMVALIVDGGNAWAQQRITQNGSDAAADAGATVLGQRLAGDPALANGPAADAAVELAVDSTIDANKIDLKAAYYTDRCGVLLRPDGTKATGLGDAAVVGAGDLPTDNGVDPVCSTGDLGHVAGVRAIGTKPFSTYIARLVGVNDFTADGDATAVTGFLQSICESSEDESCTVLPVTFPTTIVSCDGQNNPVNTTTEWPKGYTIVPLCKNGPGNVGWLDWTPPGGGASELADAIIPPPYSPSFTLPVWEYMTQTGNINSKPVEDALNYWHNQIVLIPMFDLTCSSDPDDSKVKVPTTYGCPAQDVGGNGQNQWYRIPQFAQFKLDVAYVNGNNTAQCTTSASSATSCLTGWFVDTIRTGTVGPPISGGTTTSSVIGVQLIH